MSSTTRAAAAVPTPTGGPYASALAPLFQAGRALADWRACTHVPTWPWKPRGVYWKPVRHILENNFAMANHASTRTTELYERRRDDISLDEVERIRL